MTISTNDFAAKYAECGNIFEAAVYAGASRLTAPIEGLRLIANRAVRKKVRQIIDEQVTCPAAQGLRRIAFGRNNDAVKLCFAEEVTQDMIDGLDLSGVSEIKCGKNGVEIKFFDRQKALEKLYEIEENENASTAQSLIGAIYGTEEENEIL